MVQDYEQNVGNEIALALVVRCQYVANLSSVFLSISRVKLFNIDQCLVEWSPFSFMPLLFKIDSEYWILYKSLFAIIALVHQVDVFKEAFHFRVL